MNHLSHSELSDLAGERARNVGHRDDLRGHVARCRVRTNGITDAFLQRVVELDAWLQAKEQHHANIAPPFLADGQRFDDLVETLHYRVDLGRADAYAAWIENSVRSA